jgi:aminoglycoside phosphotransferase (APT) family kinase protein
MYSFSKIPISPEAAGAVVAAQFGSQRKLSSFVELKEGLFNAAALLELDDGFKCVLKAAPADEVRVLRYERDIMKAEVDALRLVRQRTQVPTPEVYAYDTSRCLLPSDYFISEFLPGIPLHKRRAELPLEAQASVEREMGRLARQMSSIHGEVFGLFAQLESPGCTWRVSFINLLRDILLDGQEMAVVLPLPYDELFQCLEQHFDVLDEVVTPQMVHWDLWDGNVFIDAQTHQVTGLIDFERALWGDPLIEVIFMNLDPRSNFVQGYGEDMLGTPAQQKRRMLYNIYLYLIMIIECYCRLYQNQDQENWARARLDEELRRISAA